MKETKNNRRGGAALAALLIIIIIVAAGTVMMTMTGKGEITEASKLPKDIPAVTTKAPDESVPDEVQEQDPNASQPDESQPEPAKPQYPAPTRSDDYREINYKDLGLTTRYGLLVDVDNNTILAGSNYDKKIYPASLTKVMTLVVAMENIPEDDVKFKFTNKVLNDLKEENAQRVGFEPGETVTFDDLVYGMILQSGADATIGVTNVIAGSEEEFVKLMNKKAEELGLENTHFTNASGLHDEEHYSTLKDMAVILEYAMSSEKCRRVLTTSSYTTSKTEAHPDGIEMYSLVAIRMQGYWVDCDGDGMGDADVLGGKTGFTDEAGYAIELIVSYNNHSYICLTTKSSEELTALEDNIAICENYIIYNEELDQQPAADEGDDDNAVDEAE